MHFTLVVVACLQALALAHPGARFDEHDLILPRASQNGTVGNATVIDDEPIPVLKKPCVCPEVTPDPRLNAQSVSVYPHHQVML